MTIKFVLSYSLLDVWYVATLCGEYVVLCTKESVKGSQVAHYAPISPPA